jgi:hypothetical protein
MDTTKDAGTGGGTRRITTDMVVERYFESLNGQETRKNHVLTTTGGTRQPPDIERDFRAWYNGLRSATLLGWTPGELPPLEEVTRIVQQDFQRKARIAA